MSTPKQPFTASVSFEMPTDEKMLDFMKRMEKEHEDIQRAVYERIKQLFHKFVEVEFKTPHSKEETDEATRQLLTLFSIGYKLGWNDHKEVSEKEVNK